MSFSELGLDAALVRRCESLEYTEPTPIQAAAIPLVISGSDLIGCAATGTGKTAAFLLPLLQRLAGPTFPGKPASKSVRALILAPTRELAGQITASLHELDGSQRTKVATLTGGASMTRQRAALLRGPAVVIATPGRMQDHLDSGLLSLAQVETLVLDEADRMLDMGFWPAIQRVLARLPVKRQTLLFSATMSPAIERIARQNMRQPQLIEVSPRGKAAITVTQKAYPVALESKNALLFDLLERERFERVLVFTRTRRGAERLARLLSARKHQVERIHADRSQPQREAALRSFKNGGCRVLVATDIAARGIDVEAISHVINFDVPVAPEDYVHRIGRSGRAGNEGQAITLVTLAEEPALRAIEKLTQQPIERVLLPAFGGRELLVKPPVNPIASTRRQSGYGSGVRSFSPRRAGR
ncbi:MAG: DEAD/DEAH box helicase [Acidobacteria bacterium]|nr:DEAD/DEAH box helicase [Acidobacteriota bacterium]MBI3423814.1 DEAD/DEAH box helicase [Acidobacteriota bacterium]